MVGREHEPTERLNFVVKKFGLLIYVQMSMAATSSTMTELGRKAPQFALHDVLTGRTVTLGDLRGARRC